MQHLFLKNMYWPWNEKIFFFFTKLWPKSTAIDKYYRDDNDFNGHFHSAKDLEERFLLPLSTCGIPGMHYLFMKKETLRENLSPFVNFIIVCSASVHA